MTRCISLTRFRKPPVHGLALPSQSVRVRHEGFQLHDNAIPLWKWIVVRLFCRQAPMLSSLGDSFQGAFRLTISFLIAVALYLQLVHQKLFFNFSKRLNWPRVACLSLLHASLQLFFPHVLRARIVNFQTQAVTVLLPLSTQMFASSNSTGNVI